MAGRWDSVTKRMIGAHPEDFVTWLVAEASFVAALDVELKSQHIFADALLKILKEEKPGIVHREVQTYADPEMPLRLLEYNLLASRQYEYLPVSSYVLCLREEADVPDPPYIRRFLHGEEIHRFSYRVIRLWLLPVEGMLGMEQKGLLPLVPLTAGGKRPEAVKQMVERLASTEEWDLLAIARIIGGLVFKKEAEREWFRRRFIMFQDMLQESWVYQEIGQEFLKQGLKQGLEQGREERLHGQRQTIMSFLQLRFPKIALLAWQQTSHVNDPEALQTVIARLFAAQTVEEARQIFLEARRGFGANGTFPQESPLEE